LANVLQTQRVADLKVLASLHTQGFFVMTMDDKTTKKVQHLYDQMKVFFTLTEHEKSKYKEVLVGEGDFVGWHKIIFANRDSKRVRTCL
jgi:isopenicillin N synthase-like dioxygenase